MNLVKSKENIDSTIKYFVEEIENANSWHALGTIFHKIIKNSNEVNLLSTRKRILSDKIIKKINKDSKLYGKKQDYFKLVKSTPEPLSILRSNYFSEANLAKDITEADFLYLKSHLDVKRSKQKYEQMIGNWNTSLPLPMELLQWEPKDLKNLFEEPSDGDELLSVLNNITDRLIKNEPGAEKEGRRLLENAIKANCPYVVKYLLLIIEIDLHSSIHNGKDLFALARSNNATCKSQIEMLKTLYEARNPLSSTAFAAIIFHTLQFYLAPTTQENQEKNHLLFDKIISSLLNAPIMSIKEQIEDYPKYIGHIQELKEKEAENIGHLQLRGIKDEEAIKDAINKSLEGHTLEGYTPNKYIWLHLRLFFQKIIETIQLSGSIDEQVIDEFLCEFETGWVIHQRNGWYQVKEKKEFRPAFNKVLVDYVHRQILKLSPGVEYVVHVGLPDHSIYIAFKKHEDERLEIRVDNLGGFSVDEKRKDRKRHVATIGLKEGKYKNELRQYLTNLFDITAKCRSKKSDEEGDEFANQIYSPHELFPAPRVRIKYPPVPDQKVGNCIHYSFMLGQCIRLRDANRSFFLSLPAVLVKIKNIHESPVRSNNLNQEIIPVPYKSWLRQKLLNQYLTFEGNASQVSLMKCKALSDGDVLKLLLSPRPHPGHILIEAEAGAGKTIFSQQLAHQLHSSEDLGSVIFYLPLRHLLKDSEAKQVQLVDLVESYILKRKLPFHEKVLMKNLINDSSVIWILDGLDELIIQPHLKEAIRSLFQRQQLIVTSRPHFEDKNLDEIVDLKQFKRSKMGDYAIEQKKMLIDFYFSQSKNQDHEKLKDDLKNILEEDSVLNPHLKRMCEIPLSLSNVCQLLASGQSHILIETNIAMITKLVVSFLITNAYRRKKVDSSKSPEEIKGKYIAAIKIMEKLAFRSLEQERRTHFSLELKKQVLPEKLSYIEKDLREIGLLQLDQAGGQFIHATYQEYFAACYLVKGLKQQEETTKYKECKEFILNHRDDFHYEKVFLFVAQIFNTKIQQSKDDKRNQHLSILMVFLKVYFLKNEQTPLISFLNIIFDIAKKVDPSAREFKTFVAEKINPILKEMLKNVIFGHENRNTFNGLQELISNCPDLKKELELSELIDQTFNQPREASDIKTINWILDFIKEFKISMELTFLIKLMKSAHDDHAFKLLEPLKAALQKTVVQDSTVDEIKKFIRIVLLSRGVSAHFSDVVCISGMMKGQIDLSELIKDTADALIKNALEWELKNFIEFIKVKLPYGYIKDDLIDCLVNSNIQSIIPGITHFLIGYASKLVETSESKPLEKMPGWFKCLFNNYKTASYRYFSLSDEDFGNANLEKGLEGSQEYKMLKNLQQQAMQKPKLFPIVQPIFNDWDAIVAQKDFNRLIKDYYINNIRHFLKQPPVIKQFSFCSGAALKKKVLDLAAESTVSAIKDCRDRTTNWASIRAFFSDKNLIDRMDAESPIFVDEILNQLITTYDKLEVTRNSGLPQEMYWAITGYNREQKSRNRNDNRRIQLIKDKWPDFDGVSVKVRPLNADEKAVQIEIPKKPLGFSFDFSYHGYSDTLVQLQRLASQNPNFCQQLITSKVKKQLNDLKEQLLVEINEISNIDNNSDFIQKKSKELALVENLLSLGGHEKKAPLQKKLFDLK